MAPRGLVANGRWAVGDGRADPAAQEQAEHAETSPAALASLGPSKAVSSATGYNGDRLIQQQALAGNN